MVNSVTSVGDGRLSAGSSVSTSRRWSWVVIVILPGVCPVRRERAVQLFWTDRLFSHQQIGAGVAGAIVQFNVTPNVTLGYLASITNVTLGLQRADGNVTLAGQTTVGWRERESATGR